MQRKKSLSFTLKPSPLLERSLSSGSNSSSFIRVYPCSSVVKSLNFCIRACFVFRISSFEFASPSHQLQFRQILRVHKPNRFMLRVYHNQIVYIMFVEHFQRFHRQRLLANAHWLPCHDPLQRLSQEIFVRRHMPPKIAIGKNSDKFSLSVDNTQTARFGP